MNKEIKIPEAFILIFITFSLGIIGTIFMENVNKYSSICLGIIFIISCIIYFREKNISKKDNIGNIGLRNICNNILKVLSIAITSICFYNSIVIPTDSSNRLITAFLMMVSLKINFNTSNIMKMEILRQYKKIKTDLNDKNFENTVDKEMREKYPEEKAMMDSNIVNTFNIMQVYRTIVLIAVAGLGIVFEIGIFPILLIGMFVIAEDLIMYKVAIWNNEKNRRGKDEL